MTEPHRPSIRELIFKLLLPFERGQKARIHVEDALDRTYQLHQCDETSRRFGTFLCYGILRHWFEIDYIITTLTRYPLEKMDPPVRLLLRFGLFQLHGMDSVPDYAAVDTTMHLASSMRMLQKKGSFIHALLRQYIRQHKPFPQGNENSLPAWWLSRLRQQYPEAALGQIVHAFQQIPPLTLRINRLKTTVEAYQAKLSEAEIPFEVSPDLAEMLWLKGAHGDPRQLPGFEEGWFLIQDESSARVARFLNPQPGENILEIGAAPGTKTTHMAALMENQGCIYAVDNSRKRLTLLTENCRRLGVNIVEPVVMDAQIMHCPDIVLDRVLIDAPCSGSGTIGKHPEIKLSLTQKDFELYHQTQLILLQRGFNCLKPGGVLVYSTCSLDASENAAIIQAFIAGHSEMAILSEEITILPDARHDGFYMACLLKKGS